ncbi:MAG: TlyA family RNA methyltransferase [Candidatus Hydrogenedentes bacterium]|nr:TlyA family RNA methyltransferase [Candidatus Hydrogenedentota bacterium]
MAKERLDILVQQQAGVSRSKAQGLIQTGQVYGADGNKLDKPGQRLDRETPLEIREQARFVSRGGEKLAAAFEAFPFLVRDHVCVDVGASTGGFTDCCLQEGASKIFAVDVGYGQLAWSLRSDDRVVVMERCNARNLAPEMFDEAPTRFVADCSFISLRLILPPLVPVLGPVPEGVILIKPQFEAGKDQVGKGGVVRDEAVRQQVVDKTCAHARQLGFQAMEVVPSPLTGPAGNKEFLAYLHDFHAPETPPSC